MAQHVLPHEPALRAGISRWRLPYGMEIDDIVQEVYGQLAAMEDAESIRNVRGYMWGIARNLMLMHLRRARVVSITAVENIEKIDIALDEPSPEVIVSDRQQLHLLALEVARLPEPGRSAFIMRFIHEMPHREIGEKLGMSENAVQKSVARSLAAIVIILGRGGSEGGGATTSRTNNSRLGIDEPAPGQR